MEGIPKEISDLQSWPTQALHSCWRTDPLPGQICAVSPASDAACIHANSGTVATRVFVSYSPAGRWEGSRTQGLVSAQRYSLVTARQPASLWRLRHPTGVRPQRNWELPPPCMCRAVGANVHPLLFPAPSAVLSSPSSPNSAGGQPGLDLQRQGCSRCCLALADVRLSPPAANFLNVLVQGGCVCAAF